MSSPFDPAYPECQVCGERMSPDLTAEQVSRIATNPYAYVVVCRKSSCREAFEHDMRREGLLGADEHFFPRPSNR